MRLALVNKYDPKNPETFEVGPTHLPSDITNWLMLSFSVSNFDADEFNEWKVIGEKAFNLGEGESLELQYNPDFSVIRCDNTPLPNEVWRTRNGNLALIVHSPHQYLEIDGVTPPGAAFFPSVYSKRKVMMLWYDRVEGWTVSEIMERLKERTTLSPAQFFSQGYEG